MTEVTSAPDATVEASDSIEVETFDGVIENAYGQKLPKALTYSASYEKILHVGAIPSKEEPDDEDILAFVNNKRKANARQKAMQDALDAAGVKKPTLETSVDLRVKTIMDALLATKLPDGSPMYTRETAEQMARNAIGA